MDQNLTLQCDERFCLIRRLNLMRRFGVAEKNGFSGNSGPIAAK